MTTQHIETPLTGAGRALLATGYHPEHLGREFLVVDANRRIGDNWRQHDDSLRLSAPRGHNGLTGLTFPGGTWSFLGKDDVADDPARRS